MPIDLVRLALNGPTMGTRWSVIAFAPDGTDARALAERLAAAVNAVDAQMSTYKPQSQLMQLNAAPPGVWQNVPAPLAEVLEAGLAVSRASGGAFDMALGALVDAWGFGPSGTAPDAARVAVAAAPVPALEALEVDRAGCRVRKLRPVTLDLNGIAKGYGVDCLALALEAEGITRYLVSIDGEVRAGAPKPDGTPWGVAVEKPDPGRRETEGVVPLVGSALATSGDYRHRIAWQGREISHTLDPATGQPLTNAVAAATVLAPTCMLADAWATVMMVVGPERGEALAAQNGLKVLFALRDASPA
jgi:thiamine biosynthesis lipoprotein